MQLPKLMVAAIAACVSVLTTLAETVATASWVGGGDRNNPADPANWECKSSAGVVIAGAIPTGDTIVTIAGETTFNLPKGAQMSAKSITFNNAKLTAGADWRGTVSGLQKTYTPVEYLQAPNGSYIDTGIIPTGNTRMQMEVEVLSAQYEYWWGIWNDGGKWYDQVFCMCMDGPHEIYAAYGNAGGGMWGVSGQPTPRDIAVGDRLTVELNKNHASLVGSDGTVFLDKDRTTSVQEFTLKYPIWLFVQNRAGSKFSHSGQVGVKMFSCKIWENDVLVRDFVPVILTDGAYALFDRVSGANFYNGGSGAFTGGEAGTPVAYSAEANALELPAGATIDVNGNNLTIDETALAISAATITSTVDGGTLTVVVDNGTATCNNLILDGKLKVIKDGFGTLSMEKEGQKSTGGFEVLGGVLQPRNGGWKGADKLFGAESNTITIRRGAAFDFLGGWDFTGLKFVLDGGEVRNTRTKDWLDCGSVKYITLTDDSTYYLTKQIGINAGSPGSTVELGGHTLTYDGVADRHLWLGLAKIQNGTFNINSGYVNVTTQQQQTFDSGSDDLDLILNGKLALGRDFTVRNLTIGANAEYVADNLGALGKFRVCGNFKPEAKFPTMEMQTGAVLDLTAVNGVFTPSCTMSDKDCTITFAENANVAIDVTGRTLAVGDKVIAWTAATKPNSNFTFVGGDKPGVVKEDGLYYGDASGSQAIAVAYWTGLGGDMDVENPANWQSYNANGDLVAGGIPSDETKVHINSSMLAVSFDEELGFLCDSVSIDNSTTLAADCDFTGIEKFSIADGAVIDLAGHKLTVPRLVGNFEVTDTSVDEPGSLIVQVPLLQSTSTQYVKLSGNLKLVKTGGGTLELIGENQTFTGGVEVLGGLAKAPEKKANFATVIGPTANPVTIGAAGIFDLNGCYDFAGRSFILAGGTLVNNTWQEWPGLTTFGKLTLTEDSIFEVNQRYPLHADRGNKCVVDLGGKTLIANIAPGTWNNSNLYIDGSAYFSNGTLIANGPLYICADGGASIDCGAADFNLVLNGKYTQERTTTVGDLMFGVDSVFMATCHRGHKMNGVFKVNGTFTPNASHNFANVEMQNGSIINLKELTEPLSFTSAIEGAALTIAPNAEVQIDLTGREVEPGTLLMAWETKPGATFTFVGDSTIAAATAEGLFYGADPTSREIDRAVWTGAAGKNLSDPANWNCYNAAKVKIDGVIPTKDAKVFYNLPTLDINIPAGTEFVCASFVLEESTVLADDCDLSGLEQLSVANGVVIDTYGNKLTLGKYTGAFEVTNTQAESIGEVVFDVAEGEIATTADVILSGSLKVTKEGKGTLSMERPKQTFNGGLEINEGLVKPLQSAGYNDTTRQSFGANGSTIKINEGGSFDMNGLVNVQGYKFVLEGGTLVNSVWMNWPDYTSLSSITLLADSFINIANRFSISYGGTAAVELGGHTLTIDTGADRADNYMWLNRCKVTNGTVYLRSGKLSINAKETAAKTLDSGSEDLDLVIDGTLMLGRDMTVRNVSFGAEAGFAGDDSGAFGKLLVGGVFSSIGVIPTAELQDGASINVANNTMALQLANKVSFADGAVIGVDWKGRKIAGRTKLIGWTQAPANLATLKFKSQVGGWKLTVKEDGVYAERAGLVIEIF